MKQLREEIGKICHAKHGEWFHHSNVTRVFGDETGNESANRAQRQSAQRDGEKGSDSQDVLNLVDVVHVLKRVERVVEDNGDGVVEKRFSEYEEE